MIWGVMSGVVAHGRYHLMISTLRSKYTLTSNCPAPTIGEAFSERATGLLRLAE